MADTTQDNQLLAWLKENLSRLFTQSPKFFKIWQIVSGALVLITGIPQLLSTMQITLPIPWSDGLNTAIAWASRGMFFISLLTSKSPIVATNDAGTPLKRTDDAKLPFTAAQEQKELVSAPKPTLK